MGVIKWLKSLSCDKLFIADFSPKDLLPFIFTIVNQIKTILADLPNLVGAVKKNNSYLILPSYQLLN